MKIRTRPLDGILVRDFVKLATVVDFDPSYQRESDVWQDEQRQLLIDSILNGLDVPKVYFEVVNTGRTSPRGYKYQYAVIDGKQRLETILSFARDEFPLASDFTLFEDRDVKAEASTFGTLAQSNPILSERFLDFPLPIVAVDSDSDDLIEEMFQRLNASSTLNAAERRNATGGPTRDATNALADHPLLVDCSPIRNARYRYREFAAKFLAVEHQFDTQGRVVDTKAQRLLQLFRATKQPEPAIAPERMEEYRANAEAVLDRMTAHFLRDDPLLASVGTVVVYYLLFREIGDSSKVTRTRLQAFESERRNAGRMGETHSDYSKPVNVRLREYNSLVQSTNDGGALTRRAQILRAYLEADVGTETWAQSGELLEDAEIDTSDSDEAADGDMPSAFASEPQDP